MFWNTEVKIFGRFFPAVNVDEEERIVSYDQEWGHFKDNIPNDEELSNFTNADMGRITGFTEDEVEVILRKTIWNWKNSPSSSLVQVLNDIENVEPGKPAFNDLVSQTRVIAAALECDAFSNPMKMVTRIRDSKDGGRKILSMSNGQPLLTLTDEGRTRLNDIIRLMRVWELRNKALLATNKIKMPKVLYRGVRFSNIDCEENFKDGDFRLAHLKRLLAKKKIMTTSAVDEVFHSSVLSCTSNENIAEMFTRWMGDNTGAIIEIDPNDVTLVACEKTEDILAQKDNVSNKYEREWIVRFPKGYVISEDKVRVNDTDWDVSLGNPQAIKDLNSHLLKIKYKFKGHHITQSYFYNASGTSGRQLFRVNGSFNLSRAEVKDKFEFDPIPKPNEYDEVTDIEFYKHDEYSGRPDKKIERLNLEDIIAEMSETVAIRV